jgi:2-dehydropantoate 2-reductase
VFGGFLRRAGYPVTLLGRTRHLEAIARDGLRIDGLWGDHRIEGLATATSAADLAGRFVLVLLAVKSFDTRAMAALIEPHLAPDGVVISLQNGLGNVETIESLVGAERTLGARVIFGATIPEPARARVTVFADPTAIGALEPGRHAARDRAAQHWASVIDAVGVPAVYTDTLPALLWAKAFYNAALNPLGALLDVHYGALAESAESRAIMDRVIDEAFAVARAEGVDLPWPDPAGYRREFYGRLVPATFHHRPSMLQDLERGRRTEVDAINGEIWRRARARGIVAAANEMLTRLIHLAEERARSRAAGPA